MRNQSQNERRSDDDGKSEGCIVPMKLGNSGGGKAAERWRQLDRTSPGLCAMNMDGKSFQLQNDLDRMYSRRDGHRGEPDALTAHVRFWEGARLNRPSRSFTLNLEERARSTRPKWRSAAWIFRNFTWRHSVNGAVTAESKKTE
jgi:hypothetical protein